MRETHTGKYEKSLRYIAYVLTIVFVILMVIPIFLMVSNSMKDSLQIYESPPKLLPKSPQSVSVVLDYSSLSNLSSQELKDQLLRDSVLTMHSIAYEMNKDAIFEIKVYGTLNHKTIFYSRVHKMKLQQQLLFGVYHNFSLKPDYLVGDGKYLKAAEDIGYKFDPNGINESYDEQSIGNNKVNAMIGGFINSRYKVKGAFIGTTESSKLILALENYKYYFELPSKMYADKPAIKKYSFLLFIFNTTLVIVFAVFAQVVLCSITAYPLSRLFPRRTSNMILIYFLGTMMIPFVVIMIPQLIMFKHMGMYDNYAALLVPYLLPFGFYVFLYKGFFDQLPKELFEAGKMDGASEFYLFLKVCLPLSKPIISLVALQTFLSNLQEFFWAFLVTERPELWTVNVALYQISKSSVLQDNYFMGISLLMILPAILVTVIFSEQIKRSLATTGLKG